MQREARIALEVAGLPRLPHRADPQLALGERGLGAGDPRRAVPAHRRERLVAMGIEPLRARRAASAGAAVRIRSRWPCAEGWRRRCAAVQQDVERDQGARMSCGDGRPPARPDRPRARLARRARPPTDGRSRAGRTSRATTWTGCVAGATGESPVALRRRLLLERAAWQLRAGAASPSEAAAAAGYGSLAAFSRAFARAHGVPPSAFAGSGRPVELAAPNGVHFHPPAGLLLPGPHVPSRAARPHRAPRRPPPRPRARAAAPRRDAPGRRARAAAAARASSSWGSRARRRARRRWPSGWSARSRCGSRRSPVEPFPQRARSAPTSRLERFARAARDFARAGPHDPRPRRVGRRLRRRAVRAAAVVHLRRRARPRPDLRRGAPRGARGRAGRAGLPAAGVR